MAPYSTADHIEMSNIDRFDTNASIVIPKDVFEKLYLAPKLPVKGQLRSTFANPTPLALVGFVMTTGPFGCVLMGWRAASDLAGLIGILYFFGGLLQVLASIFEFILGNTFPFAAFGTFGAFWLSLGVTNQYAIPAAKDPANFYASFGYVLSFFGVLMFIFGFCALRTNAVFVTLFALIATVAELLAGAYWKVAEGATENAERLQKVAGAITFVMTLLAFYLLLAILLESVDFPLTLPVGDLSTRFKGKRARAAERAGGRISTEEAEC